MSFDRPKWLKFAISHFLPSICNQSTTTTKYVIISQVSPNLFTTISYTSNPQKTLNSRLVPSVLEFERQMLSPNMSCLMPINTARRMMDLSSGRVSFQYYNSFIPSPTHIRNLKYFLSFQHFSRFFHFPSTHFATKRTIMAFICQSKLTF